MKKKQKKALDDLIWGAIVFLVFGYYSKRAISPWLQQPSSFWY
ncbi:hypothetical protein [Bacillus sp. MUM 13]|nr:hypothetical protein [Bacillus sp. MUM 13]